MASAAPRRAGIAPARPHGRTGQSACGKRRRGEGRSQAPTIEAYLRNIAGDCSREELKRLFYVAATRARQRLYSRLRWTRLASPIADSILRLLWPLPGMQQAFAPLASVPEPETAPPAEAAPRRSVCFAACLRLFPRLPCRHAAAPAMARSQADSSGEQHRFEWVGELLPRVGVVAHSFLQRIALDCLPLAGRRAPCGGASVHRQCTVACGSVAQRTGAGNCARHQALRHTLEDERGRWLLSPHPEHGCELAVSAVIDGKLQHVRIDRTFIEDGTRWLIDYKITEQLGGDPLRFVQMQVEKYRPDIERYARGVPARLRFPSAALRALSSRCWAAFAKLKPVCNMAGFRNCLGRREILRGSR